ncbi:hypothetical protein BLNAU_4652 [Blattamonas nauphoetae]|uniref:Uncharacterized protein n=1 Tax=Blattamonas nauphoetae TaxID=2049346 RepID=A0ABQ9Y9M8_9EUKA|nr:hypothetical protein BLNAU_4652 [Blattamonas nauphoetae]
MSSTIDLTSIPRGVAGQRQFNERADPNDSSRHHQRTQADSRVSGIYEVPDVTFSNVASFDRPIFLSKREYPQTSGGDTQQLGATGLRRSQQINQPQYEWLSVTPLQGNDRPPTHVRPYQAIGSQNLRSSINQNSNLQTHQAPHGQVLRTSLNSSAVQPPISTHSPIIQGVPVGFHPLQQSQQTNTFSPASTTSFLQTQPYPQQYVPPVYPPQQRYVPPSPNYQSSTPFSASQSFSQYPYNQAYSPQQTYYGPSSTYMGPLGGTGYPQSGFSQSGRYVQPGDTAGYPPRSQVQFDDNDVRKKMQQLESLVSETQAKANELTGLMTKKPR